jgi:glycosyltransferase involved in cell wall biosynthesis
MKILHLSSEKTWRGGEQQIAYLVEEQMRLGHEVVVACREDSVFEKYCEDNKVTHITFRFANSFDVGTAKGLKKLHKSYQFDVIHIHSSRSHSIAILATKFGLNANLILSRRVDFPSSGNPLSNHKYNHSQIKKIICVSGKVKEIIGVTIKDKSKLCVVYDGIDLKRFEGNQNAQVLHQEFDLSPETKIIANISALADHKDYITFVDTVAAFVNVHDLPVKFFIIGEGECRQEIEEHIAKKGVEEHIIMTGFRNDIKEIFKEIDVFLMTSKEEGLGSTVLDAFANEVPVVATAGGGIPEVVKHEETGLLAPIKSPVTLAEYVNQMLSDKELSRELTRNALRDLHHKFTKEVMTQETLECYKSVLS